MTNESQIDQTSNVKTKKEKTKPKAEPIKLKIKTNARLRNNQSDLTEPSEEPEVYRSGRSTRRTTPQHTTIGSTIDDNAPVPGTANYELYRTLTESPSQSKQFESQQTHFHHETEDLNPQQIPIDYQQFHSTQLNSANIPAHLSSEVDAQNTNSDTERGILPKKRRGRNKAKFEANTEQVVEEPIQKRQRGRRKHDEQTTELIETIPELVTQPIESPNVEEIPEHFPKKRITAAAKKQYRDESNLVLTESVNPLPAPIEEPLPSDSVSTEPATNRRGRKAKAKANQNITNTDPMSQPEVSQRPTRTTRHTANGNLTRVIFF